MGSATTKAYILTNGVEFSESALVHATHVSAKGQNLVYNAPRLGNLASRPQEILLTDGDGYTVCVSAVAPVPGRAPARVTYDEKLVVVTPDQPQLTEGVSSRFVPRPSYYDDQRVSGAPMTRLISACGLDELNVWPWHDCAVRGTCSFCGINKVSHTLSQTEFSSLAIRDASALEAWTTYQEPYLRELTRAVEKALADQCYDEHVHMILISGNLADDQLDDQATIYGRIASALRSLPGSHRFTEGIVAVTAPPRHLDALVEMKAMGVDVIVLNLEAYAPDAFRRHCPGKHNIGRDHYLEALKQSVRVFGWGLSWSNFVLGLEPARDLLAGCEALAGMGITPGANVLHLDVGGSSTLQPPDFNTVVSFYRELAEIYRRNDLRPYYCAKALRTSLANEAFQGRL
jgi:hypothetical protein